LFIHKSNVVITKVVAFNKRENKLLKHALHHRKYNIFLIRVLHDANTTYGSFHKPNQLIHMLSTMLKKSNPFITSNTISSMKGENMVKRPRGIKVKILFQGLHMTCVIFVLVYNL
jgi:hypothetical protein